MTHHRSLSQAEEVAVDETRSNARARWSRDRPRVRAVPAGRLGNRPGRRWGVRRLSRRSGSRTWPSSRAPCDLSGMRCTAGSGTVGFPPGSSGSRLTFSGRLADASARTDRAAARRARSLRALAQRRKRWHTGDSTASCGPGPNPERHLGATSLEGHAHLLLRGTTAHASPPQSRPGAPSTRTASPVPGCPGAVPDPPSRA